MIRTISDRLLSSSFVGCDELATQLDLARRGAARRRQHTDMSTTPRRTRRRATRFQVLNFSNVAEEKYQAAADEATRHDQPKTRKTEQYQQPPTVDFVPATPIVHGGNIKTRIIDGVSGPAATRCVVESSTVEGRSRDYTKCLQLGADKSPIVCFFVARYFADRRSLRCRCRRRCTASVAAAAIVKWTRPTASKR